MSQITTHILDTATGKPAEGVSIILYSDQDDRWQEIAEGITNKDGRITDLLGSGGLVPIGLYKMKFSTKHYFDQADIATFYPWVEIIFEINSSAHYHIPLLISPFGYTTYRGS